MLIGRLNDINYRESRLASRSFVSPYWSRRYIRLQNGLISNGLQTRFTGAFRITRLPGFLHHAQNVRSSVRYWMASAMCFGSICCEPSRSATVRATFRIRSWARAVRPC